MKIKQHLLSVIKPVLTILFLLLASISLKAQLNLVPNPSFEDTLSCPITFGDFSVSDWVTPTFNGTADYFHACNDLDVSTPQNGVGWQDPRTGNAYVGFLISDLSMGFNIREYIQCKLTSPLTAGELYEVSFWVSRADSCSVACDNIGIHFSQLPISGSTNENLPYVPQVVSPEGVPITDAVNWTQIIDTITVFGGEEYITVGIFTNDANTTGVAVSGGWMTETYYFIDDVSVVHIPSLKIPNVFTPNNDGVNDEIDFSLFKGSKVVILNRWGNEIFSSDKQATHIWLGKDNIGRELCDGVYFYKVELKDIVKTGFIHLIR